MFKQLSKVVLEAAKAVGKTKQVPSQIPLEPPELYNSNSPLYGVGNNSNS